MWIFGDVMPARSGSDCDVFIENENTQGTCDPAQYMLCGDHQAVLTQPGAVSPPPTHPTPTPTRTESPHLILAVLSLQSPLEADQPALH